VLEPATTVLVSWLLTHQQESRDALVALTVMTAGVALINAHTFSTQLHTGTITMILHARSNVRKCELMR
jgi:hypothetical protein